MKMLCRRSFYGPFVELGEATDAYKKGKDWNLIVEELVDVIFYILDFIGLVEKTQGLNFDIDEVFLSKWERNMKSCLLYTSPSPRDRTRSRMPSSA